MTPEFAGKFDETAKVAGELATKTKATVKADVREVGVRDGDADRVTLIIFVNQTTTSTITQGKPRVDLNRTRFTMVRKAANGWSRRSPDCSLFVTPHQEGAGRLAGDLPAGDPGSVLDGEGGPTA